MSINRLMLLAGVLTIGACGTGPLQVCNFENPELAVCDPYTGPQTDVARPNVDPTTADIDP